MSTVSIACRVLLIVVFAVAAAGKLRDLSAFATSLAGMRVVPAVLVGPVARTVAGLECASVALLATPFPGTVLAGLVIAGALLAGFTAAIVRVLRRGIGASCRCFGRSSTTFGRRHLARNGLLLVAAATAFAITAQATVHAATVHAAFDAAGWATPDRVSWPAFAFAAAFGAIAAAVVIAVDEVADLFRTPPAPAPFPGSRPSTAPRAGRPPQGSLRSTTPSR